MSGVLDEQVKVSTDLLRSGEQELAYALPGVRRLDEGRQLAPGAVPIDVTALKPGLRDEIQSP
ncbi:hypothetical protein DES52_1099 [Deinococcus yavapaiensis KR-236]|uniref:Uncharacterized protein n=1 Tax=Deinococcus yavapaiensis KR-236 TaxID=694435 RepID=A0A318S683_9DEIO|nr:hypothetical protein DES52_1099 [Deinococcus yavapaiensis KR-236]